MASMRVDSCFVSGEEFQGQSILPYSLHCLCSVFASLNMVNGLPAMTKLISTVPILSFLI